MQLMMVPPVSNSLFSTDLQLVIRVEEDRSPELLLEPGLPTPDRHLVLGLVQSVAVSIEELDPESVELAEGTQVALRRGDEITGFGAGVTVVRNVHGHFGALCTVDPKRARRLARLALRWFTGTIRLDVP